VLTPSLDQTNFIREELELLINQTEQQERVLEDFHSELVRARQVENMLRARILESCVNCLRKRQLLCAFYRMKFSSAPSQRKGALVSNLMVDSVNLNETLKNLAKQLESPTGEDMEMSQLLSTSMPFSVMRKHFRK